MIGLEKSFPLVYSNTYLRTRETLPLTCTLPKGYEAKSQKKRFLILAQFLSLETTAQRLAHKVKS